MEQQTHDEILVSGNGPDHFVVDDLLDFSNGDDDGAFDDVNDPSVVADSCNSSSACERSFPDAAEISGDLCVIPCEDLAELEWLSNFVEESFSSEDQDKLHLLSGFKDPRPDPSSQTRPGPVISQNDDAPVPARARSKRSRAAASTWPSTSILAVDNPFSPTGSSHVADVVAPDTDVVCHKKKARRKDSSAVAVAADGGSVRRCMHCETEKTPQWRTGPMGPKTLCNACGVRYKSGRLVPEYRPAASPTFVMTKHSNSHRKVLELRQQKDTVVLRRTEELLTQLRRERVLMGDVRSNGDDFLIHQHVGPHFGQLI
ncbi:PREDICTED: GATA transcription factor 9 [Tarenaya hassleriana]|uniref:GATA transcription factor 9 n=1 Tax=Tarenaya hassleriana TaxID=28532 RepID=UPI00053C70E9|nr:PREDICTED: GATA transcription factor 9 [Tarenaya hassleriana]